MSPGKIRSWLFTIPLEWLTTAAMISVAVAGSLFTSSQKFQIRMYRAWASMTLFIARARLRVVGAAHVEAGRNYVIASNHLSLMDTPVLLKGMPIDFKFLAKQELMKIPFLGWYIARAGHLTVSRGSIRSSIESMNECARRIREGGVSVLVFAEGTRGTGVPQPFKDGAAYLAIQAGVPILPVAVWGTQRVLAAKSSHFRAGQVELRIGEPIPVQGLTTRDRGVLTQKAEACVRSLVPEAFAGP